MEKINPSTKLRVNTEHNRSIKKAIIPIAGLGTRFLPLSKVFPKELWPLVDKPVLQYIVEEAIASGIKEIIFVNRPEKEEVLNYFRKYFKKNIELEKFLKQNNKKHLLDELKIIEAISKKISFSQVLQKKPLGDGHAVLQAEKLVKNEPCTVLFGDDIVDSKIPCLLQLINVFKKYKKPVIALSRIPKEKIPFYGIVKVEKITKNLFKIKGIVEKPKITEAPSNLAIVGKYIITPEVFDILKNKACQMKGEIKLVGALNELIKEGETVYGYEFQGKWLECGNKLGWLTSHFYLSLKHPQFGRELKKYL